LKIDYIVPSCHDTAYIAAAAVAKNCHLPGFDEPTVAGMIHQKDELALGISNAGLPGIETRVVQDNKSAIEFLRSSGGALVIKPSDMTGGRGVSFVNSVKDLSIAIELAKESSLSKKVLAQEFIEGSEHGLTAIIRNQKVIFSFFDDEYHYLNRYRVAGTISPSSIDERSKTHLKNWIDVFSEYYKLIDGLFHVQFIQQKSEPKILEVCRRPPGDLYPYFVESATGIPYTKSFILGFMGLPISTPMLDEPINWVTLRHVVLADRNGIYKGLSISESIFQHITFKSEFKANGEPVTSFLTETLAIFILKIPFDQKNKIMSNIQKLLFPLVE
jgi:biotin carboxylase